MEDYPNEETMAMMEEAPTIEEAAPTEPRPSHTKRVAVVIVSLCLGAAAVVSWAYSFNHRTQLVEDGANRGEPLGDVIDEGSWSNIAWIPSECFCSICGYNQDCRPANIAAGKARVGCNGAVWSDQRAAYQYCVGDSNFGDANRRAWYKKCCKWDRSNQICVSGGRFNAQDNQRTDHPKCKGVPASHLYLGGATSRQPSPSPSPRPSPSPTPSPSPSASTASKLSTCQALKAGMSQKCNSASYKGSAVQPAMLRFPCGRSGKAKCPFSSGGNDGSRACSGSQCWKCLTKSAVDKFYADNCATLMASTASTASSASRASSASSTGYKDVGDGYCSSFKELTKGKTQSECLDMIQSDRDCENKNEVSYGKGSRAKRCLCDKKEGCTIGGKHLGSHGFDRIQRLSNSAPAGYNAAGNNCNCDRTRVASYGTGKTTLALCANACSAKSDCKSFGLWTNHAKGNCVLWKTPCTGTCSSPAIPTNTKQGWRNDVYNKGSASTASTASTASSAPSASSTSYKDVGDGYCSDYKELAKGKTQSECLDMIQKDRDCKNKNEVSYGKGGRAKRCLCDRTEGCTPGGKHLGSNGFDRIQRLSNSVSKPMPASASSYTVVGLGTACLMGREPDLTQCEAAAKALVGKSWSGASTHGGFKGGCILGDGGWANQIRYNTGSGSRGKYVCDASATISASVVGTCQTNRQPDQKQCEAAAKALGKPWLGKSKHGALKGGCILGDGGWADQIRYNTGLGSRGKSVCSSSVLPASAGQWNMLHQCKRCDSGYMVGSWTDVADLAACGRRCAGNRMNYMTYGSVAGPKRCGCFSACRTGWAFSKCQGNAYMFQ